MAHDRAEAERLAGLLDDVNQQRRTLQHHVEQTVHERIAHQYGGTPPAAIVLGDADWHLGGGGDRRRPHRRNLSPARRFSCRSTAAPPEARGRSIPAFDLYDGLQHCAEWLQQFGGHRYAAGLTMAAEHLPALQEAFIRYADDRLGPDDRRPVLRLEAVVSLADVSTALVNELAALAPHGSGQSGCRCLRPVGCTSFHPSGASARRASTRAFGWSRTAPLWKSLLFSEATKWHEWRPTAARSISPLPRSSTRGASAAPWSCIYATCDPMTPQPH